MNKTFNDNFLLTSERVRNIYRQHGDALPNIDFISNINVDDLATNKRFSNITELFIDSNKKMRQAMRYSGVDEKYITGSASDFEKFRAFCGVMPDLLGNLVYMQRHYELKFYFDCDLKICPENCEQIWNVTSEYLQNNDVRAMNLLRMANVESVSIVTDGLRDLSPFEKIRSSESAVKVYPVLSMRGIIEIEEDRFVSYLSELADITDIQIKDFYTLGLAVNKIFDKFESMGCRSFLIDSFILSGFVKPDRYHADLIMKKAINKGSCELSGDEVAQWRAEFILFLAEEIKRRGWCLHYKIYVTSILKISLNSQYWRKLNVQKRGVIPQLKLIEYLGTKSAIPNTVVYSDCLDEITLAMDRNRTDTPKLLYGVDGKNCADAKKIRASFDCIARMSALGRLVGVPSFSDNILCKSYFETVKRVYLTAICDWIDASGTVADDEDILNLSEKIFYRNIKELQNL